MTEPEQITIKITRSEHALLKAKLEADRARGRQVDPVVALVVHAADLRLRQERNAANRTERDIGRPGPGFRDDPGSGMGMA